MGNGLLALASRPVRQHGGGMFLAYGPAPRHLATTGGCEACCCEARGVFGYEIRHGKYSNHYAKASWHELTGWQAWTTPPLGALARMGSTERHPRAVAG
jgi:hypothetical protein